VDEMYIILKNKFLTCAMLKIYNIDEAISLYIELNFDARAPKIHHLIIPLLTIIYSKYLTKRDNIPVKSCP